MQTIRMLFAAIFLVVVIYTSIVVSNHGINLLPVFFGDIAAMGWPGQFNLDFLGFLTLSGFWLAWRHEFSSLGIALGALGFSGGAPVLTAYLFAVSLKCNGDPAVLLLGADRAERRNHSRAAA